MPVHQSTVKVAGADRSDVVQRAAPSSSSRPAALNAASPNAAVLSRDARYRRTLAVADILAAAAAVFLVVAGIGHDTVALPILAAAPIVVVLGKVLRQSAEQDLQVQPRRPRRAVQIPF